MADLDRYGDATQLERALTAIQALRARLDAIERARREPVAVIGVGCRLPGGVESPETLWALLTEGVDAITPVPPERWDPAALAAADSRLSDPAALGWGGFLADVDSFDAGYFGISPREAAHMDPQQRLLLEVAVEALEAAGQALDRLAGSQTGVFVGIHSYSSDYTWRQVRRLEDIDAHTATGTAHSVAANRLSYAFDWHGPSLAIDTACSSSLVAVHLAVQSLRRGECELALAGGVNLMLSPEASLAFDRLRMLSPDGRCKTFDARADGMVRAEGCGLVVLKRLSDAVAAGDEILAVIAGSAVNQDGRTNSLTAPNGKAQVAVIRRALADAELDPAAIGLVEAHGTGTALGDPIEVEALAEVLGRPGAGAAPCFLGAIKTNLGHLEGAAGIAGLIKAVLALRNGVVPPNLHFSACNPHIDLTATRLRFPTRREAWPRGDRPRYAAVSSFGFGGTNAHVVLREAPAPAVRGGAPDQAAARESRSGAAGEGDVYIVPLSARSPGALTALARRWRDFLALGEAPLLAVAATAARRRSHHAHRLAVVGGGRAALGEALGAFADGRASAAISGEAWPESRRGLAFVFTGRGPPWTGLGRELLAREPAFREVIEACDGLLRARAGWSLIEALHADPAGGWWGGSGMTQPAHFALQVALAALWRSWGIHPEAVVGHSLGEVAAAHVAGALSLEDAVRVVETRGRLMRELAGTGRMVAVGLTAAEAEALAARHAGRFAVAAINGPASTVLSGDAAALEAAVAALRDRAVFVRWLPLDAAFHSPALDSVRARLVAELDDLVPAAPSIPIYSTVSGGRSGAGDFDAAYWGRNARQTVHFASAVAAMAAAGINTWLEIGPHPALGPAIEQTVAEPGQLVLGSLRRGEHERAALLRTLGALYAHGYPVDWAALYPEASAPVPLPAYPWQRQRYWLAPAPHEEPRALPGAPDLTGTTEHRPNGQPEVPAGRAEASPSGIADWFYELAWHPKPLAGMGRGAMAETSRGSEPLATGYPARLAAGLAPRLAALAAEERLEDYRGLLGRLDAVAALYVRRAFTRLGWDPRPGERVAAAPLAARLGVQPHYHRLVERLLAVLAEDGGLAARGEGYEVQAWPAAVPTGAVSGLSARTDTRLDADSALTALRMAHPAAMPEVELTERCGSRLAGVLTGGVNPLDLLFPGGSTATAERLYRDSAEARVFQAMTAEVLAEALGPTGPGRPAGQRPRVLEIGAGTGGTTSYALPRLRGMHPRYTFTDISPHFLGRARTTFRDDPALEYRVLDIERDPAAQGFAPGSYDIVLAANVLHATADVRRSLDHIRMLLAPGGLLVLLEGTASEPWIDITFGLSDGWWRFTDTDRRRAGPLLDVDAWRACLAEAGFGDAAVLTAPPGASHQAILIARAARDEIAGTWLVLADKGGVGAGLAERLAARGASARVVEAGDTLSLEGGGPWQVNPARPADLSQLVAATVGVGPPLRGAVCLWGLDIPVPSDDVPSSLEPVLKPSLGGALHLAQALLGAGLGSAPRLWLVTRGAWAPETAVVSRAAGHAREPRHGVPSNGFAQAPLWGLGRVLALEHPELGCMRVDLDGAADRDTQADRLLEELARPDGEDEVAYRGGLRHVARLVRSSPTPPGIQRSPPVRLAAGRGGVLDDIHWVEAERRAPGRGEVEIRVQAAGLSFRDLLNALAVRDDPDPLGCECAGWISALGAGVTGLDIGDAVVALAPGSLGSYTTTDARRVVRLPAGVDPIGGATLPTAFLTAEHALRRVAGLARGERVLIHAAAGGVGQAAVQIAMRLGAEIVATAGSPEKRAYLAEMGIPHVLDSRSLDFAEAVLHLTGGRGVDVVLNQLSGDFIPASLRALADDGRFVELGKRDIWSAAQVAAIKPRAAYHVVDLAAVAAADPEHIRELFAALVAELGAGALRPLPAQVFPFDAAPDAFRHMAQARHIGKIVLVPPDAGAGANDVRFRSDASYVITGGLDGLGLAVAEWMADRGARHFALIGRRPPGEAARARLAAIEAAGARVMVAQGDVADARRLAAILSDVAATMPPLRGVIHSAGVLDDGALVRQDWARFATVLAPKVDGAWNLHVLTRDCELDWFLLFSSAAAVLGSAGQANHAAANAFLDALAQLRRAEGRPAVSIDWGAWSGIGAAVRHGIVEHARARGIEPIEPARGLAALAEVLRRDQPQLVVASIDWARYVESRGADGCPPLFEALARGAGPESVAATADGAVAFSEATASATAAAPPAGAELRARLLEAPPALRLEILLGFVSEQASRVLSLPPDQAIEPRQALHDLGMDSLMSVELRNRLAAGSAPGELLPATIVFDHPSPEALASYLARGWSDELPGPAAPGRPDNRGAAEVSAGPAHELLAALEALSDEEVDRRLAGRRSSMKDRA